MSWPAVDWSQAPEDAVAWSVDYDDLGARVAFWQHLYYSENVREWRLDGVRAPMFGYTGHPRDSLTLRPQKDAAP